MDYICFKIPDDSMDMINSIGIIKRFSSHSGTNEEGVSSLQAIVLRVPSGYECIDLSPYKVVIQSSENYKLCFHSPNYVLSYFF